MSGNEWKMKLHLSYAGQLRTMAGKFQGSEGKALLLKLADDHEQLAKSHAVAVDLQLGTGTDANRVDHR